MAKMICICPVCGSDMECRQYRDRVVLRCPECDAGVTVSLLEEADEEDAVSIAYDCFEEHMRLFEPGRMQV